MAANDESRVETASLCDALDWLRLPGLAGTVGA